MERNVGYIFVSNRSLVFCQLRMD